jgi:anthranilate synthase component 1
MYKYKVITEKFLADTLTPVNVFLRLRQKFPEILLLESADYRGSENSLSFICFNPLLKFTADEKSEPKKVLQDLIKFISSVEIEQDEKIPNGFFGYCTYDAIRFFEDIELKAEKEELRAIPEIRYGFYEFVIVFNHFKNEISLLHNKAVNGKASLTLENVKEIIFRGDIGSYPFKREGSETSNLSDAEHLEMINKCKKHIARGDVFQIVPSRRFIQKYSGDEFNVYRVLRSINPSPYLFYFDFGDYRMFGSSPEAQISIKNKSASIYPIAGTYPRSADHANDRELAETLKADPKENAEHVMLVDLARNDLSKHCKGVNVEVYKEVQFYSHVIHLVSKVTGELSNKAHPVSILADTFPAGTLSGAPKYRAMQLIDQYERGNRGIYGGCIGLITTGGDIVHGIAIRSFLSKDNHLFYQAGGGVVFDSNPEAEVSEVKNKLGALKQAILEAEKLAGKI